MIFFFFFVVRKIVKLMHVIFVFFLICFLICFFVFFNLSSWLGFVFFLVYIRAILILIFYVSSLSSKKILSKGNYLLFIFFFSFSFFYKKKNQEETKNIFKFNEKILSLKDGFYIFLSLILLIRLWVSTKLQIFKRVAMRLYV